MIRLAQNSRECQEHRFKIKTLNQRMQNVAVHGTGLSQEDMAEAVESKYLSEVLLDYVEPDELRMAILHYEILGRPLSLRDPSGQIIGL